MYIKKRVQKVHFERSPNLNFDSNQLVLPYLLPHSLPVILGLPTGVLPHTFIHQSPHHMSMPSLPITSDNSCDMLNCYKPSQFFTSLSILNLPHSSLVLCQEG